MQYKVYGWTPTAFNEYNESYGIDINDPEFEDENNLPFFNDLENDEVNLLDYATLITESDDEDEVKDKLKQLINELIYTKGKYRIIKIWDDEEYMFL